MSKFPHSETLINTTVRVNVGAQLDRLGHDLNWLAGELGVSVDGLLGHIADGHPFVLWDAAEVLGVPTDSLVAGVA